MSGMNVRDRNAGFATGQEQIWGFDKRTGIDSRSYGAPGAKTFYVDPNNTQATDAGNLGEDPSVPLATIQYAVTNLVRDHQGDTIVVGANDAWQFAPNAYRPTPIAEEVVIPASKGGFRIVGASTNPMGVVWTPTTNSGVALTVHGIDVLVEGFAFYPGALTNCIGILIEWDAPTAYGENCTIRSCYFDGSLDYGIQLDYCWYNQIYNNYFDAVDVAGIHNLSVNGDPDYVMIHHNRFMECAIAIDLDATDNGFIYDNLIVSPDPTALTATMIDLNGTENLVSNNYLACTMAQANTLAAKGGNDFWVFNHCTDGEH
jgi:parallel beta-helix repeat protein